MMLNISLISKRVSPKIEGYVNECLIKLVEETGPQKIMEIGTLHMQTAKRLCALGCEVHSFDIDFGPPFGWPEDFDIDRRGRYNILKERYPNFHFHSNTNRVYDTYNWSLMKMLEQGGYEEYFDVVFSDGAHVYLHDTLAFFLSDRMLKNGGVMFFDDYGWVLGHEKFTGIEEHYTKEQLAEAHVKFLVETVVNKHPSYTRLGREVFLKK